MSKNHSSIRRALNRLTLGLALAGAMSLQGCSTTLENIALGAGVGVVGTVSALGCLLACQDKGPGW
ncbi:hypothetical protein B0G62_1042 [Paraburkholderia eburnea]|uniref:Uncharacterized protein n=1 Tax=Paraburkholderia eburnea TaxID=1189126 RepID=A0A2S4MDM4_9BURK|nr:hypothetical protein [Paraburkholderia eburnea]POR52705.1 hypothetical protein B0G62_1042 [Paraburkholderia eburnea]PRZ23573.1 hypothetical protein BX588_1042 [Paraburkholderia eburnea]